MERQKPTEEQPSRKGFVEKKKENSKEIEEIDTNKPINNLPFHTLEDEDELPSRFLSYPKNSQIKYRPYTFGETKRISQSKLSYKDTVELILSGVESSFPKKDITLCDFLYLSLLRNLSTLGNGRMTLKFSCSEGHKNETVMETVKVEYIDVGEEVTQLPAKAKIGEEIMEFSLLTIGDYLWLTEEGKEQDALALLTKQCKNFSFEEAYQLIYNCSAEEGEIIDYLDKILYHGIKPIKQECKTCKKTISLRLTDGKAAVLLPFRKSGSAVRDRIQFGSETPVS